MQHHGIYDEWRASGFLYNNKAGKMKNASRHLIITWILEAWAQLDNLSSDHCIKIMCVNFENDGTEDNIIHCFKRGQPCSESAPS